MPLNPVILWFLAGLLLILSEFMIPGVILVFFGAGAWMVALGVWLGILPGVGPQLVVFAVTSVLLLVFLRRRFRDGFLGRVSEKGLATDGIDDEIGSQVTVLEDMAAGAKGRVEYKGAAWQALSETSLVKGQRATITAHEGITLIVKPE